MKTRIDLKLAEKQLSTKTELQSFRRVFFQNRNFILFHSCIIDNLVYILTLFGLFADSYDCGIGEIEPRLIGSPPVLPQRPATQIDSLDLGLHVWTYCSKPSLKSAMSSGNILKHSSGPSRQMCTKYRLKVEKMQIGNIRIFYFKDKSTRISQHLTCVSLLVPGVSISEKAGWYRQQKNFQTFFI